MTGLRGVPRRGRLLLAAVVAAVGAAALLASLLGGERALEALPGPLRDLPCAHLRGPSPAALTTPLMDQVARGEANTDLYVSSDATVDLRLTVRFGDELAYDAVLRGAGDCAHPPIYRSSYHLPPGRVRVQVTASDGRTKSTTFSAGRAHRWLTVGVQDGFPLHVDVWQEPPAFG